MVRYIVMFRWNDRATSRELEALETGVEDMFATMPYVLDYRFARDAELEDGSFDAVLVADFPDRDSFQRYRRDDNHGRLSADLVAPILADHAAVQVELI